MGKELRIVHYVNQFFGGIGGEEKAGVRPRIIDGASGPGKAIQNALGDRGKVVATVICGDNYIGEKTEQASAEIVELIRPYKPDIVIAGPALNAGRYGIGCGAVCKAVHDKLNIPAVTGMYEENPGVELYHKEVWIVPTGDSAKTIGEAITRMVKLAMKLATEQQIGNPAEEGYFPHGNPKNEETGRSAAQRAVEMLLKKLRGEPFETEAEQPKHFTVTPANPIKNLRSARIALVTDGGVVPLGNPDRLEASNATRFGTYSLEGINILNSDKYDVNHGGFDTALVKEDPHRMVPLDTMRQLEKEGLIGKLHEKFYTTAGVGTRVEMSRKMGRAIAEELKRDGVDGVILTSA